MPWRSEVTLEHAKSQTTPLSAPFYHKTGLTVLRGTRRIGEPIDAHSAWAVTPLGRPPGPLVPSIPTLQPVSQHLGRLIRQIRS